MPNEVTSLTLRVTTEGVTQSAKELEKLEKTSMGAEKATDALAMSNDKAQKALRAMASDLSKVTDEEKKLSQETDALTRRKKKLRESLEDVTSEGNQLNLSQKQIKDSTIKLTREIKKLDVQEERLEDTSSSLTARKKKLTSAIEKNKNALVKSQVATKQSQAGIKNLGASMNGALPSILAVGAGIGVFSLAIAGIKGSVRAAADIETLETSFVSLVGGVKEARNEVAKLTAFTASTPFQLEGVAKAARQLITAKGNTVGLQDELKILGDIASTSAIPIDELAAIYTKAFNKGKIQAEELNQISERGIPIMSALAEQLGVTKNQVFQLGSQGKLSFQDLKTAFEGFADEGGFAFNAMIRQSETLNGGLSTLKDNIKINSAIIGKSLAEAFDLSGAISSMSALADATGRLFDSAEANAGKNVLKLTEVSDILTALENKTTELAKLRIDFEGTGESVREISGIGKEFRTVQAEVELLRESLTKFSEAEKELARNNDELERAFIRLSTAAIDQKLIHAANGEVIDQSTQAVKDQVSAIEDSIAVLSQRNTVLQESINKQNELKQQESREADTGLFKQFLKIEQSLQTQTEKIESEFDKSKRAIEAYQEDLFEVGELTEEEGARVAESLDRLATIRQNALDDLLNSNAGNELLKQFEIVENGMKTQTEVIEDQFDDRRVKIEEYMQSLILTGNLTATELDRITKLLARVNSAETESLDALNPQEAPTIPTRTAPIRTPRASVIRVSSRPQESEFDKLRDSLQKENRLIEESYLMRLELIRKNTIEGSQIRAELESQLNEAHAEDSEQERLNFQINIEEGNFQGQLDRLNDFYDKRKELILSSSILTEQEKNDSIMQLEEQRIRNQEQAEQARQLRTIDSTQSFFGDLESIQQAFGKRGAEIAKTAAIANATIDTARNAILAYQRGLEIPVIGNFVAPVFAAAATAAGLAQISTIKSQSVGNFENGGIIPGGSFRGDNITANVNSGEMILNTSQQRQLFDVANGGNITPNGSKSANVTIINQTTREVQGEASTDQNGNVQIIVREAVRQTKAELTAETRNGGGTLIPQMQQTFNLRRQG